MVFRRVGVEFVSEIGVDPTFELIVSSDSDLAGTIMGEIWDVKASFFSGVGFGGRSRDRAGAAGLSSNIFLTSIFSLDGPVLCNAIRLASASGTGSDGFVAFRDSGRLPSDPPPVFIASFFWRILSLNSSTRLLGCGPPVVFKAAFP